MRSIQKPVLPPEPWRRSRAGSGDGLDGICESRVTLRPFEEKLVSMEIRIPGKGI
jgi:hypothetical protein